MKRFMIFAATMLLAFSTSAQDLLVKRNGEKMNVKVLKITKKNVEFVRHGTELPVYKLPISDIEYIEYPMGDRDTFGRNVTTEQSATKEPEKWHGSVPTPDGKKFVEYVPESNAEQTPKRWHGAVQHKPIQSVEVIPAEDETIYGIGDIYNKNGIKGVVVMLTDGGRHGLIMSLDEACLPWCNLHRKKQKKAMGASDRHDGMMNMLAIEKYIAENNL